MDRREKEKRVLDTMFSIYCRRLHGSNGNRLCPGCRDLRDYAFGRVDKCPKGDSKSSCRKCEIHCYAPEYRARIRAMMRYVGPRMLFYHPLMALRHLRNEMNNFF
ncbi:MAG: nitrous oxide-stimulated promoter family protein [Bacteroides sp.]|nr:nitrous oxide-stimulated promoter family protein [Bacteroides sp.]